MDRYQKVEKPKPKIPISENEIRITSQGLVRNYLSYATTLIHETHGKEIVLKGMGQAISKTVAIAEIIKRRIPRLHQDTAISSVSITDVWEPIEEGLLPVEQTRHVSMISITLSTKELNKNSPGYQPPSQEKQTRPQYNYYSPQQQPPPRQMRPVNDAGYEDSYGRGRGRGRGRGPVWSRGGYANYQDNGGYSSRGAYGNYRDNGGYSSRGGYTNYHDNGGYASRGGYSNYQENGGYPSRGGYASYQDNGGYSNRGRGGSRGGYRGAGYGRGRGGVGRGYGRGRGQMAPRPRGGGNQV